MLASQLIYTNCSGWSVWSKSIDITKDEEDEIVNTMNYKRPSDKLPYEPTEEQINLLFPKKLAYFYLRSGKVCLAQSTFVGHMYSDEDPRMNNYIIHAFVFDKSEDLLPMNYIESGLFWRRLTYQEWHDQNPPDTLPKKEIGNEKDSLLTKQEMDFFFDKDRSEKLKWLVQAIMDALDVNQKVTFYDKHSNLKYWYKAISLCFPKAMQKELTFNTFANTGSTKEKIRNIIPDSSGSFDYHTQKYAFDFESAIFPPDIVVTHYVQTMVETLKSDVSNAIELADELGKISNQCKVDLNTALDIHFLLKNQMEQVDEVSRLNKIVQIIRVHYQDVLPDIANTMYDYGLKTGKWVLSREIAEIYRFIFDYSDAADKDDMVYKYIVNQAAFGVPMESDSDDYCASFKDNAPFAWAKFLDYILSGDNLKQYKENETSFNSRFLVFDTFVNSMSKIKEHRDQEHIAKRYFVDITQHYIQTKKLSEVLSLVKCIGKLGAECKSGLIKSAYSSLSKDGKRWSAICSPEFTLELAEECGDLSTAQVLISRLISENKKDDSFIELYIKCCNRNTAFYSSISKELNADTEYVAFIENVEKYKFNVSPVVTKNQLQTYYEKYFITGKDNDLLPKRLRQYLFGYYERARLDASLNCYDTWIKGQKLERQMEISCVEIIGEAFFSSSRKVLKEYILQEEEKIKELLVVLQNSSYDVPGHYDVIVFGEGIKKLVAGIKSKRQSPNIQDTLNKLTNETFYHIPKDICSYGLFVEMYLADVFELYFALANKDNFKQIYCKLFQPLHSSENFGQHFYDEMNKLTEKEYESFLYDTVVCVCCGSNAFDKSLMQLVANVFETIDRGKREKLFAQLMKQAPSQYKEQTKEFIGQYQKAPKEQKELKESKGFWDKLKKMKG